MAESPSDDDPDPHHLQPQAASSSRKSDPAAFEGEPSLESMAKEWARKCAVDVARCMVSRILGYENETVMDIDRVVDAYQDTDTDPDRLEQMRLEMVKAQACITAPHSSHVGHVQRCDPVDAVDGEAEQDQTMTEMKQSPTRLRLLRKTPSSHVSAPSVSTEAGQGHMPCTVVSQHACSI